MIVHDVAVANSDERENYLRRGLWILIATTSVGYLLELFFNMRLSTILAAHEYGDFKVAEAFIHIGLITVILGGAKAAMRFLPLWMAEQTPAGVWEYTRFYLQIIAGLSLLVIALVALLSYWRSGPLGLHHHPLLFAVLVVPFAAASSLLGKVLQAGRHLAYSYIPYWVGYPLLCIGFTWVLVIAAGDTTAVEVIFVALLSTILVLLYQVVQISRLGLMPIRRDRKLSVPGSWLRVSMPMMLVIFLQVMIAQSDIYLLELLGSDVEVGMFAAAATTAKVLFVIQGVTLI